jgi:hypothetical protein
MQQSVEVGMGRAPDPGWNEGWFNLPVVGSQAGCTAGAQADEIYFSDLTSVNLFKLATAALRAQPGRRKIISDVLNFPSDLYILQGIIDLPQQGTGWSWCLLATDEHRDEDLRQVIDDDSALVCLSHVAFKSAFLYNMALVTELSHAAGALVVGPEPFGGRGAHPIKCLAGGPGCRLLVQVPQRRAWSASLLICAPGFAGEACFSAVGVVCRPASFPV